MTADQAGADATPPSLITICIPTYNNAAMLGDAIASALAQTYAQLEVVVLDNCSTDSTIEITRAWAARDSRLRVIRHQHNIGMAGNFNRALDASRTDRLLILCADDLLEPRCIEVLAAELDRAPQCAMAACARQVVDKALKPVGLQRAALNRTVVPGEQLTLTCFSHGNVIGEPSAVLFRRSAARDGFDQSYCQLLDLDMWMKILKHGDAILIPDALCRIRRHDGQWSEANIKSGRVLNDKRLFFRAHAKALAPVLSVWQKCRWDLRMASSVVRSEAHDVNTETRHDPSEVFHPSWFPLARRFVAGAYRASSMLRRNAGIGSRG